MRLINGETTEAIFKAKADMALGTPKEVFFSAARMVALMPTVDAVPVVRCRDCKYCKPNEYECGCDCPAGLPYVKADDFCRKDD